ncbi:MAG TPA: ABC transporter permease [Blastocatellia bacterium]|nr:ABC transporter permease [Blastocatellia bacterium]
MNGFLQDLRYSARILSKKPGFTSIAVMTLALGIGANTAIFSVVDAVLLRSLPYPEPDRLMQIFLNNPETAQGRGGYGNTDFLALKERNSSFEKVAAISPGNRFSLTGTGAPEQVIGAVVSADFFDVLKVKAQRGRTFLSDEDKPGSPRTVVVSNSFWEKHLNSDADVVGQSVTLNGESYEVIGVMPPDFRFSATGPSELWTTLQITPPRFRPPFYLRVIGRLKPGTAEQEAQAELGAIATQVEQQYPSSKSKVVRVSTLKKSIVGDSEVSLSVLLGAVFFILLIASVNVSNLLLARASEREKEMAVRAALGAARFRLIRQALTESLTLAVIGGTLGWLLALWGVDLIVALSPENLPRLDEISVDRRVLGFTLLITLLSGLVFGIAPALQSSHVDLNATLKEGGRTTGGGHNRLRGLFIVTEFGLALMLLIGAGLMIRSFLQLQRVNPGFNPDRVVTAQIALPQNRYGTPARVGEFQQRLLQNVQSLPGVQAAAASMSLPPDRLMMHNPFVVEGQPPAAGQPQPTAEQVLISPDYFRTLGIRLNAGRPFSDADNNAAPSVVIINETMARSYFPNQNVVGSHIQTGDYDPAGKWVTIVGIVDDVKYSGLQEEPQPTMYTPFLQNLWWRSLYLSVRTEGDPLSVVTSAREAVWAIDRDLPVSQIKTMTQLMSESVAAPRTYTLLLGLFGGVAMLLAAIGIYGVIAYAVTQRTREIGIRMALGAQTRDVVKMIVKEGMTLALVGVAIGLAASFALTRVLASLLYGVSATDSLTFLVIALLLASVALLACYLPARRATKVDPMVALRYE